ncbi:type IV pilin protein [Vibrio marisflavi]|uniref:Fimbrial protein n=1 Tax=Vibrio marisflavi CECT 7928 TaxID=634439 RepID=A0ABM9A2N2_9VIBR|nr:type IV pilin protein [Vibrio marisflavi]CAH0538866.1 hypothetical protein VMF7928_01726 [Vibrio marisflavi CECT 7928]
MNEKLKINFVSGMTLLELLFVVTIIGLLTSIVSPAYNQYIRKAHRQQAISDIGRLQLYLESNYQDGYDAQSVSDNGVCQDFCTTDQARYQISIATTDSSYTITATPVSGSGQENDTCSGEGYSALSINQLGESTPSQCWQ